MRVVFDTNIFISALHFKKGIPRTLLGRVISGQLTLITSKQILAEVRGVLRMKFGYSIEMLDHFEELLMDIATIVDPQVKVSAISRDPDDNLVLECAIEGNATAVVSGDKDLIDLHRYENIQIYTPREFLEILTVKGKEYV